ncbi:hypothetical protein [Trichlorobacter lovleyi]|uniref:hypothetical protein n=1 Tax=Trichlorobacter lovleyi TaxID=313985 RepID=UPI0024812838|nr:hypothetical protein [Trichlorobacter lovleyi]
MSIRSCCIRPLLLLLLLVSAQAPATVFAAPSGNNLLIYCGITMVRPITDIARLLEKQEKISIAIAQGGSEDLYQSAEKSQQGPLIVAEPPEAMSPPKQKQEPDGPAVLGAVRPC